ncbi:MAG: hypothetical protein JWL82_2 [Parcubacteria group bacterium]|nr:hypothetical protein [Parcubacteria group bacterium]
MRTPIDDRLQDFMAEAHLSLSGAGVDINVVRHVLNITETKRPWRSSCRILEWILKPNSLVFRGQLTQINNAPLGAIMPGLTPSQLHAFEKHVDWITKEVARSRIQGVKSIRAEISFFRRLETRVVKD